MKDEVVVVGAGVSGLTCAVCLLEAGYRVRVVAAEFATDPPAARTTDDRTTLEYPPPMCSRFAAAMWYPFAIEPPEQVACWAKLSLWYYRKLRHRPGSGVSIVPFDLYFGTKPGRIEKSLMAGCNPEPIPVPSRRYVAGIRIQVPFIETMVFLPYLESRIAELHGTLERGTFTSLDSLGGLARVVVNCTGLGAKKLCRDNEMAPIRGQVLRVGAPAVKRWSLALPVGGHPVYVIPRSDDCVPGGSEEEGVWDEAPDEQMIQAIVDECLTLEPALAGFKTPGVPAAGLRPGRDAGVRLEHQALDDGCTVIHNYGHGGAGFTVAWGCAEEVKELVDQVFELRSAAATALM